MQEDSLTDQIRRRAHEIWLSEGCPHGRDHIHWVRAEAEFREKLSADQSNAVHTPALHERPTDSGRGKRKIKRQNQPAA